MSQLNSNPTRCYDYDLRQELGENVTIKCFSSFEKTEGGDTTEIRCLEWYVH